MAFLLHKLEVFEKTAVMFMNRLFVYDLAYLLLVTPSSGNYFSKVKIRL